MRHRCLALFWLWSVPAAADPPPRAQLVLSDTVTPTSQLAQELGQRLSSELPPNTTAVLFRDCTALTTCLGQVPSWFSHPDWLRGIERSNLPLVPLESTVGRATLNRIDQTLQGQSDARVSALLDELAYVDRVTVLITIRPAATLPPQLAWTMLDTTSRRPLAEGVLTYQQGSTSVSAAVVAAAPLPTPLPLPPPPEPRQRERMPLRPPARALAWTGASLSVVGLAGVTWSWAAYRSDPTIILTTEEARRIQNPYVLANTAGWASMATGAVMVSVPLWRR